MNSNQNTQNVIDKYNKYLTKGQKAAIRKRAGVISTQNAKTRSEIQTQARQGLRQTNDFLSSMGLSSNLRQAPSSGVDEESRRMPEFRQQLQGLRAQEQGVLDKFGRRQANATIAARRRAAEEAARRARGGGGVYLEDPNGAIIGTHSDGTPKREYIKDADGRPHNYGTWDAANAEIAGWKSANRENENIAWNAVRTSGGLNMNGANLLPVAKNMSLGTNGADTGITGRNVTRYEIGKTGTKIADVISNTISALNKEMAAATKPVFTGAGADDARQEKMALRKMTAAKTRMNNVIDYAAEIGAISKASAETFKGRVNNGTFDYENSGAYLTGRIQQTTLNNAKVNAEKLNTAVTGFVGEKTPTKVQAKFFEAYRQASITGSMDDLEAVGAAYVEVLREQNNAQIETAQGIAQEAIDLGVDPIIAGQAMDAFKAGDTQGFFDILNSGVDGVNLEAIKKTSDKYFEQGYMDAEAQAAVYQAIEAGDVEGAQKALEDGVKESLKEQEKALLTEAYEDALTNDLIYKGEDAAAWNHFDAKYRIAMMTDTPEAWEEARDAYTDVVAAAFNTSVLQAKADADNAVKYGITQQEADEAVEAYKNGDTETYLEILGRCGLGGEQPGYVACLERDAELAQFGIDYATFQSYATWSDADIDEAIDSLTAVVAKGSMPEDEETVEMMIRYNQWIADGKTPEQAQEITGLTDEEIAKYAGKTQEELTAAGSERLTALKTLEGVKKARTADRNTEKVQEYMALSLDEIGQRIDDINAQLKAGEKTGRLQGEYMNSGTLSKTERERLEQDKVLLGYAQSRLWAQEKAKTYETTVTKAAAELRKSGAFDIRAEAAMQAGKAVNSQIKYENGKFYFTYDDDEVRGEFAEGVSDRLKVTGRTKVPEDRWNELGWTGTGDTYFNAQVFQSADGEYVVMSTVTNSGVPMSPSWAMKYQEKLAKGSDPDALRLGVFDSREEAESYAYDVDEIAGRYSTGFDRNNVIDGEIGAALGVFALINDPAMLWAGYGSDSGDLGPVKYAEHKLAEQAIAEGKEGEGLAYEAIKGGWTAKGNRALEKEAMAFGANTVSAAFNWYTCATADEKKLLAYYCATDPEKAGDYYAEVNKTINERVMNVIAKVAQEASGAEVRDENGNVVQEANGFLYVASKAATFITKPLEAAGGIYVLWNSVTGQEVDPNNKAFIFNTWDTAVRQTQYEALQAKFDARYGKEKGGSKLGQATVFAYQTLDSVIDSWINAQMGLAIGGTVGHGISLAAMGLNATGETTRELIEKGVPQDQAKKLGMLAGVFEALFEVVSLENIIHGADDLTKEWWKRAGISGVLEGSEELFTKAANIAVNSWVLDASSDYSTEIAEMMTGGRGYATAAALATWNQAVQALTEAAGGVLSGDITGLVNAFKANFNAKSTGKAIRAAGNDAAIVEAARKAAGKAGEYLQKIGIGVATNRNLSDLELGRLNYALAMTDLDTITGRVNGLVDDGTITKAEGKAVREYLDNLYQASAHGYANTAYGIDLDTSALEGVSDSAMQAVSAAAFEMTEGRADNMNAPGNTATGEYSTEAAREEQRELRRMNAEQVTAEEARTMVEQGVVQKTDFSGTVFVQHTDGKPSREQKTAVKFASAMAKAGGTEIVVHDTLPTNGVMIDGVLHVALDSDRGFVSTVAHEMTHWLRAAANDDSYGKLVSFLTEQANGARRDGFEKLVEQKANEYRELYPTATDDEIRRIANDEAVATLCETMLSDETFVRELMQKDATLFEKIYNWIGEVLDNFRSLLASDKEVRGTKEAERWVQDMETARDLWYACMTEAKANAEAGAMETEGVVFSKKKVDIGEASEREKEIAQELLDILEITKQKADEGRNGHNKDGVGYWSDSDLRSYFKANADADLVTLYMSSDEGKQSAQRIVKEIVALVDDQDILSHYKRYLTQTDNEPHFTFDQVLHGERDAYRKNAGAAKRAIGMMFGKSAKESGKRNIVGHKVTIRNGGISVTETRSLFNELAVNVDDEMKTLADKVFTAAEKANVRIREGGMTHAKGAAAYAIGDRIQLSSSYFRDEAITDERKAKTLLHEVIHSLTVYALNEGEYSDKLSKEAREAVKTLNDIYRQIQTDDLFKGEYALKEVSEMVAELSDANFREKLKQRNLFDRIIDAVCHILGIERKTEINLYEGAKAALYELIDSYDDNEWLFRNHAKAQDRAIRIKWGTIADNGFKGEEAYRIEGGPVQTQTEQNTVGQVPVYDLRQEAEQKLADAETAEQEAIESYGENSAEAEAAAQEADAAYVELQRIREEERLDRENEERLATEGTPEEIAEATSFDYGLNADETVRTENDRKQTQTEEDAETLRALDEEADREAYERRMKDREIPLPEEGREIRDERTAEEYEADILENEDRNAAEANRAATEARIADEVRQNRIDEELRETEAEMQRRRNENDWTEADKREQDRRIEKLRRETERLREKYENETDEQKKVKREWEWHNAEDKLAQAMRTRERMNRKGRVAPKNRFDGTPVLDEAMASIEETERVKTDEDGKKTTTKVPEIIEKIVNGAHRVGAWSLKTSERMIDAVAKDEKEVKEALDNIIQRPLNEAAQRYTQNLLRRRGEFNKKIKDLGIWETGSKEAIERTRAKSAAIQKYGEGFYYNEQGERLTYTIDDLKKDFPDDWQKIVEAEQYCRDLYDDYHDMYNEMLERIYPNVIEHLIEDEKQLQGLVDKEKLRRDNQLELAGAIKARIASIQAQLDAKKPGTQAYTDLQNSLVYQQGLLENAQHLAMIYEGKAKTRQQQLEAIVAGRKTGDLVRNRRLARRTDYYHHFTESADGFARLAQIWNEEESDIDPLLAGKTSQTNPRKGYAGFAQRRIGEHTQYDAIKGMHLYMNEMERRLAYDPVANHYKNLIDQLRRAGHNGVNGDGRMEKDVDSLIRWLEEERNQIVGKTNSLDRQLSDNGIAPRKLIKALKWLNSRVKANRVVGNVHSAAVQASNLTNAMTYVTNLTDWASAIMDFVKLNFSKGSAGDTVKQIMSQSGFMTQRYGLDALEYDETKGLKYAAGKMMGYLDEKAGQLMWLAAYNQYKAMEEARDNGKRDRGLADTGHTYRNAIEYADDITRRSTAGRGIGELAPLMTSSVVGMISPFQIEVNNTFQNLGEQIKKKNFKGLAAFALATTLMNTMSEVIFGDRPLPFDLIDAIVSALKGDFDDDDEDEEEQTTGKRVLGAMSLMGKNTVQTVMNGVPMASLIQSMVGGLFDDWLGDSSYTSGGTMGASAIGDSISGAADFAKHVIKGDVDTIDKAWTLALQDSDWMNVLLPWGGAQLQRTLKGVDAAVRGYSQKMNKDGELEAQFAIDSNPLSFLRSATFGKWSTKEGKAYLSGETRGLTAEKTEKMKEAKAAGMDPAEFFRKMAELKQMSATKDEYGDTVVTKGSAQLGAIAESEASEGAKKAMLDALGKTNAMRDRWEADASGIGIDTFLRYASDYGDKTDIGEDETAKNAFLMKVAADTDLSNGQKIAMTKIVLGKDGKKAAENMQTAMDAGVDVQKYLGYYLRDGKQEEKLDALMADESLTAEQKGSIAKLMYPNAKERDWSSAAMYTLSGRGENEVSKANVAIAKGVSPEKVNEWYDIKSEKRTDPATGAIGTVDQSEVLDRLAADKSLKPAQKAAIQTMLYPDSKPRDYSNEGWYYLSATSSGTEGKAYKYAKIAVEQGIPLAACVAETKEYNRRDRTKTGHGSSGGCTTKDTKEICKQVAKDYRLNNRQASILQKIYLGKWK